MTRSPSRGSGAVRGVRASFVFLTRIPVGGFPYRSEDYRWATAHAPLVGCVVGAATALCFAAFRPAGDLPAAVLAVAVSMLVTGAFHEDGLADTADALGGGSARERVLEILKDSRIGSFGAAALGVSLLGRCTLIANLGNDAWWALPLVGGAARTGPVWLMALMPYVTSDAHSKSRDVSRGGWPQAVAASGWLVAFLSVALLAERMTLARTASLLAALIGVTALCGWRYHRRLGGITGDFLGATEQIAELAVLLVLAWAAD